MALNIKNSEVERLATELSILTGETKTEAIRKALEERKKRLGLRKPTKGKDELLDALHRGVWSQIPEEFRGKGLAYLPVDEILGLGPEGY